MDFTRTYRLFLRAVQTLSRHFVCVGCTCFLFFLSIWLLSLYVAPLQGNNLSSDLPAHLTLARQLAHAERSSPYPGFHFTILFFAGATGLSLESAAVLVLGITTCISCLTVYLMLTHHLSTHYPPSSLAGFAFVLSTVSAIYAPFFNKNLYLGQGAPNIWHNPTWMMMQPFALWSFFLTERCLHNTVWRRALPFAVGAAFLLLCSTFAKPNFSLVFIPAIAGFVLLSQRQSPFWSMRIVLSGVIVSPTLFLLSWQYASYYGSGGLQETTLIFAPFEVWGAKTPSIPISAFLTLAFPIAVLLVIRHVPQVRPQHSGFLLAWLLTAIAFLQRALLAESGQFKMHGNWAWGYMIALKIIFIHSAIVLLHYQREESPHSRFGIHLAWGTLFLHFGSGLFYLGRLCSGLGFV